MAKAKVDSVRALGAGWGVPRLRHLDDGRTRGTRAKCVECGGRLVPGQRHLSVACLVASVRQGDPSFLCPGSSFLLSARSKG